MADPNEIDPSVDNEITPVSQDTNVENSGPVPVDQSLSPGESVVPDTGPVPVEQSLAPGESVVPDTAPATVADSSVYQYPSGPGGSTPYDDNGNLNPGWQLDENNNPVYVGTGATSPLATSSTIPNSSAQYPSGPGGSTPYDDNGYLNPGWKLDANKNPVYVGTNANGSVYVDPATQTSANESRAAAALDQLRTNPGVTVMKQNTAADGDWRVRLRLADSADYLYRATTPGILAPLRDTDGVIFPYTPRIDMVYSADHTPYDLVHSNYRGYFYKGSKVGEITMNATFTAQDTNEANYLLAVIHFLRSATKMFYGQDQRRGTPPPLVYLQGLGEYQFNDHPCVISQFNYNLPDDVDYIRARPPSITSKGGTGGASALGTIAPLGSGASAVARLTGAGLVNTVTGWIFGGNNPLRQAAIAQGTDLGTGSPTYVPTKMNISITLLPMLSRLSVSQNFSLQAYANGNLLKKGYW